MVGDLTEKVQGSQSQFEQLVAKIPGYAGYKAKEQRREADKLLRLHVARQYDEQMKRLDDLQYELTSEGQFRVIVTLERASLKLQLLIDRIRNASYGYAGLFDAVKVDETALDALYEFDLGMADGVNEIAAVLDDLANLAGGESLTVKEANTLVRTVQSLNDLFSQRQDAVLS